VLREGGFPRRPRVSDDDRLVLYASVWRRVFGIVVAIGEAYRVEHPRWPWRIALEPLLVVPDLDLAPPIEAIGVAARSMSQQSHIRLDPVHYSRAVEALSSIASDGAESASQSTSRAGPRRLRAEHLRDWARR
jgi:hypothetical protein